MKKFLIVLLVVVVISTTILAAPMVRGGFPVGGVKPGFGYRSAPQLLMQNKQQLFEKLRESRPQVYSEYFKAMNLSKEQAKQILEIVNEAKEKLSALEKEYQQLKEQARNMTLNQYRETIRNLNQKRAEIIREANQKIGDVITVEQISALRNYRLKTRYHIGSKLNFFVDEILKALEDYAK